MIAFLRQVYRWPLVLTFALLAGPLAPTRAASSPETLVDLNEGIRDYLRGHFQPEPPEYFLSAIERFTAVLETEPDNPTARLFRALCYGRIGLLERAKMLEMKEISLEFDEILKMLVDPAEQAAIQEELAEVQGRLREDGLADHERFLLTSRQDDLEGMLGRIKAYEGQTAEEIGNARDEVESKVRAAIQAEQWDYRQMLEDVGALVAVLDSPESVLTLLEVVALTKVARIDETLAFDLKTGDAVEGRDGLTPAQLRQAAAENLNHAAQLLEAQLQADPASEHLVRTKFFLGVIRFRQAVPRRTPEEDADRDRALLVQARDLMSGLIEAEQTDRRWRSYAELYLGLICTELGAQEPDTDARALAFQEARDHLDHAARLDIRTEEDVDPFSDSGVIPYIYWRQQDLIEQYEQAEVSPRFRSDLQLSVETGAHRDTNVVLLGERTDLPRGIGQESDFGFTLGMRLDYTLDLGRLNRRLDRWTIGIQGRVSQLWHVEVDEFDEQNYGGSAAVQYELIRQRERFGPVHLRLQYDYDYTLLGRDPFVGTNTVTPNVRVFALDRKSVTDVFYTYSIRDYREPLFDIRFDRDGEYHRLGVMQSFKTINMTELYERWGIKPWGLASDEGLRQDLPEWPVRYLQPFVGFRYDWDATSGDEFDKRSFVLTGGADVPLPYGLSLDATAEFDWQDYSHGSLIDYHRRGRRDLVQRYSVGLSRTFVLRAGKLVNRYELPMDRALMTLRAHATWTLDDSNVQDRAGQAIFEYDRVVYGLSLAFTFD